MSRTRSRRGNGDVSKDQLGSPGGSRRSGATRAELLGFLKEAGFAASGDLVLMEPRYSETREVRRSEKAVVATISTRARDRHGDIIDPAGARLERYRKNPVVLWGHDYGGLPIARSLWERVRETDDGACELVAKPQFHLDTELSREIWALLEKGVLSAWSVGFIPEDWEAIATRGIEMDGHEAGPTTDGVAAGETPSGPPATNGPASASAPLMRAVSKGPRPVRQQEQRPGFIVRRWDLIEYSCVPVPANFEALTHELKARRITAPALVKSLAPLGLRAPDLVPYNVSHGDTETRRKGHSHTSKEGRARKAEGEHAVLETTKGTGGGRRSPRLRASVVKMAVERAFERVLRRARGEGLLGE